MNLSVSQFLELTPEEINFKIEAHNDFVEKKDDQMIRLAYNVGACCREAANAETYPVLEDLFVFKEREDPEDKYQEALETAKKLGDPIN